MPLPTGGAWPPENLAPVFQRLASWSAWYSGNPDDLAAVYGGQGAVPYDSTELERITNRPSQYRGGVVGLFARWWWGEPVNPNQKRTKLHVPIGSDMCRTSAELLFSEPPAITVPTETATDIDPETGDEIETEVPGDETTQARLDELVDDGMHATLLEAAELAAALGGVYLKVCWDLEEESRADRPWLHAMHADAAVPEWRYGKLVAVTFWQVLSDDNKVIRHLERHEVGAILHGVYEGTPEKLGQPVPLDSQEATRGLLPRVDTGLDRLTAVYIPNMRPNRLWRNLPAAAGLGRSDFAGAEQFMDALDETYSSWQRDIRYGKGRILVPETYLENLGTGRGSKWDPEREVYEALGMLPASDGKNQIEQVQFAIRVTEHRDSARDRLEQILRAGGYSAQTFGLADDVAVTATEIKAREKASITTRNRKINYFRPGLAEALETLLMIDANMFGSGVTPVRPDIDFGDYVGTDLGENAQTAQLMRSAEAASTETLVAMLHPDWDDDQVAEEVERIEGEKAADMPPLPPEFGGEEPGEEGEDLDDMDQDAARI